MTIPSSYPHPNQQNCANCYCSRAHQERNGGGAVTLRCHATPPTPGDNILARGFWPIVSNAQWCAAWSPKSPEEEVA
jgi:hypothetical protein